ncbi:hypothetical protein B296_00035365 [Ensete ventricosum]|uniref:Uncharacterized protein n=1 Tax=Ensete ventricosum TaxID=4639 RepID=A0A426XYP1_ENSVE|nr:hypothetical protein B296_00035365 [Ensete ventricosum]
MVGGAGQGLHRGGGGWEQRGRYGESCDEHWLGLRQEGCALQWEVVVTTLLCATTLRQRRSLLDKGMDQERTLHMREVEVDALDAGVLGSDHAEGDVDAVSFSAELQGEGEENSRGHQEYFQLAVYSALE